VRVWPDEVDHHRARRPFPELDRVQARAAVDHVVAAATFGDEVISGPADQRVTSGVPDQGVVPGEAVERIVTGSADQAVVAGRAGEAYARGGCPNDDDVRSRKRGNGLHAGDKLRGICPAAVGVVPKFSCRGVVDHAVARVLAGARAGAGKEPPVARREGADGPEVRVRAAVKLDLVRADAKPEDAVGIRGARRFLEEERIVAVIRDQKIIPRPARQSVVALAIVMDLVIPAGALEQVIAIISPDQVWQRVAVSRKR